MLNKTILIGRLARDPELRYTPNGTAVANFTIAVNRPFAKEGDQQADFINCVVWRRLAENLANYQRKGNQIAVEGRIQTRSYENQEGKRVYVTEVVADNIQYLDSKNSEKSTQQQRIDVMNEQIEKVAEPADINDEDLPF